MTVVSRSPWPPLYKGSESGNWEDTIFTQIIKLLLTSPPDVTVCDEISQAPSPLLYIHKGRESCKCKARDETIRADLHSTVADQITAVLVEQNFKADAG